MIIRKKNLLARVYRNDAPGEDGSGQESVGTGNDARIAMLERINDANDAERAEELAGINDDGTTTEFTVDDTTAQELARAEAEANQTAEVDPPAQEPPAKTYKLKINGREVQMTEADVLARAQKVEAADQYLVEAARIKRDAERLNTAQPVITPQGPTDAQLLEERRALVRAIQMGTEEEAIAALEKLQQPTRPAFTDADLARTVDERMSFSKAIERFKTEYQDVLADPVLANLALQTDQALVAQGDKRGYWQRYEAIGNDIRAWRAGLAPKPGTAAPAAEPAAGQSRQQRKADAPSVPKAATGRAPAAAGEEEGDETVSDVIAGIAKARGGPQWLRS